MTTHELNSHGLYVPKASSRRNFLRSGFAAGAGLALSAATHAHAANGGELKLGVIGCGGRGSGAADQAMNTGNKNVVLWAMGDAHQDRLNGAVSALSSKHSDRFKVTDDRKFVGLDAYEKVVAECDIVILATPPGFRPYHFEAAINAGKHVFMEKPVASDAPGVRKVLEVGKIAEQKGLKVVCGLQRRYQDCYLSALQEVKDNNLIGDITGGQVYWNDGGVWVKDRLPNQTELQYQLINWYYFTWLCGDHIAEQHIHNIDIANWFIGANPVSAQGMGGRQVRTDKKFGEIYDHHYVEFTYPNGVRVNSQCRHQKGCYNQIREEIHGTKGILYLSNDNKCRAVDYKGNEIWRFDHRKAGINPYQKEHNVLQDAIINNKAHNDSEFVAHSTMTSILGRNATYGGKNVTWDEALNSQVQLMPAKVTWETEPPVKPKEDGSYDIAIPGVTKVV